MSDTDAKKKPAPAEVNPDVLDGQMKALERERDQYKAAGNKERAAEVDKVIAARKKAGGQETAAE